MLQVFVVLLHSKIQSHFPQSVCLNGVFGLIFKRKFFILLITSNQTRSKPHAKASFCYNENNPNNTSLRNSDYI